MGLPDVNDDQTVLAGEYVLGTLDTSERREAEALMRQSDPFRREIWWWERQFSALGLRLKPVTPRPVVWMSVLSRIHAAEPSRKRPSFVATWAAVATAASVALAITLVQQLNRETPAPQLVTKRVEVPVAAVSYVALLQMPKSTMQWTVSATPDRAQLSVRVVGEPPSAITGHDAELWLITDAGPVSLGVIPKSGEVRRRLPQGLTFSAGRVLAVSLEPPGGSPTGHPTGPVVTTAPMVQAG